MSFKKVLLILLGAIGLIAIVALVTILSRDEADRRYSAMAIGIEDHCMRYTDGGNCVEYAECYRSGIEAALPRDTILKIIDGSLRQSDIPADIEQAVADLEKNCGISVGLKVEN